MNTDRSATVHLTPRGQPAVDFTMRFTTPVPGPRSTDIQSLGTVVTTSIPDVDLMGGIPVLTWTNGLDLVRLTLRPAADDKFHRESAMGSFCGRQAQQMQLSGCSN
jgi:hypothetical protein